MFVQAKDLLNRPAAGLGVGLALARSIAELHHGTITVQSEGIGTGSEFRICLPLLLEKSSSARIAGIPGKTRSLEMAEQRPYRILVVDDNVDAAAVLAGVLKQRGHEVICAHTGSEALSVDDSFRAEIVLLDVGMPGVSGLDVARHLRNRRREPRPLIVAVTGWGSAQDRERSQEAGFDLHMVKPLEEEDLLALIEARRRTTT